MTKHLIIWQRYMKERKPCMIPKGGKEDYNEAISYGTGVWDLYIYMYSASIVMIYILSSVKVAQHTTLLLYESIYIVSFLFHEYETDIDFKVFYMNYFEILEKLFLLQTRYFRASNRVSIINWRIIMFKKSTFSIHHWFGVLSHLNEQYIHHTCFRHLT